MAQGILEKVQDIQKFKIKKFNLSKLFNITLIGVLMGY